MSRPLRPQSRARVIPTLLEVALALAATPAEAQANGSPAASSSCAMPVAPAPARPSRPETKTPDARRAAAGPDAEARALAMAKDARQQYELGRKDEAIALLSTAHGLYPARRIALVLARWEADLRLPARALAVLEDLLRDATLTPPERDEALRLVEDLHVRMGRVSIAAPADVTFHIDDGREVFGGDTIWMEPGPHVLIGAGGSRIGFHVGLGALTNVIATVPSDPPRIEPPLGGAPPPPPPTGCACRKEPSYANGGHFPESVAVAAVGLVIARRRRRR